MARSRIEFLTQSAIEFVHSLKGRICRGTIIGGRIRREVGGGSFIFEEFKSGCGDN